MQQYSDQKHQVTVTVDSQPQAITNLEAGSPAVGVRSHRSQQPTAIKTGIVIGGICGITGMCGGIAIGVNQQNRQLDRAESDLIQVQGDMSAARRETEAYCKRVLGR